jgi:SWI/SNF-related matrix-associated actin-dependent regulator of chromatin subfamily A-like protein 1
VIQTSPYDGTCNVCGKAITKGSRISWTRGVRGASHALCSPEGAELKERLAPSRATDAAITVPAPAGLNYYPFQRGGIAFALRRIEEKHHGTLIGDQPGLGKTLQALGVINACAEIKTVLIVCPASLRTHWKEEARKWLTRPAQVSVAGEEHARSLQQELFTPEVALQIISPNMLAAMIAEATKKQGAVHWDLCVLDEAHIYKTWKAKRSTAARLACRSSTHVLGLTGTPIPNRVIELFPILSMLEPFDWDPPGVVRHKKDLVKVPMGEGAGLQGFGKKFCGAKRTCETHGPDLAMCASWCRRHWTYEGSNNLEELQERLRTTLMVRRLKRDVLAELPPKMRQVLKVPPEDQGGILAAEKAAWKELGETPETLIEKGEVTPFNTISDVRHKLGLAKAPFVLAEAEKILEAGEKVILFGHHRDVLEILHAGLLAYEPVLYYGGMNDADKEKAVRAFQDQEKARVFIGSIMAAGVGLTLHASSHVVFAEESWRPLDVDQAEDRAHRIGQKGTVNVLHVCFDRSLDARMVELIVAKQAVADLALDTGLLDDEGRLTESPEQQRVRELREERLTEKDVATIAEDLAHWAIHEKFAPHTRDLGRELAKLKTLTPKQAAKGRAIMRGARST